MKLGKSRHSQPYVITGSVNVDDDSMKTELYMNTAATSIISGNINRGTSSVVSAISERDIFIYSCSARSISFEIDSISKEISCAEHEYMNIYVPLTYRAGDATAGNYTLMHGSLFM